MRSGIDDPRRAVLSRLAALDRVVGQADPATLLPLARTELHRLADGWRRLLSAHHPGADGRCEVCHTGIRARRRPCQVWRAAHEHLVGEGVPHARSTRHPFGRARTR